MAIDLRLEQPQNAYPRILVTPLGMLTFVRLEHPLNRPPPISVTLSGMLTSVSLSQPRNASVPIAVTVFGMLTVVMLLFRNAWSAIFVTVYSTPLSTIVPGMVISVSEPV